MKRGNNLKELVESIVHQEHDARAPDQEVHRFFEFFVADQILKDFNLNDEEILSGLPTIGQRDGGIDGLYLFLDDELLVDPEEFEVERRYKDIQIYIIQCKFTDRVPEDIAHLFDTAMYDLLEQIDDPLVSSRYDTKYVDVFRVFQSAIKKSILDVRIKFSFFIAHLAGEEPPHLRGKTKRIAVTIKRSVPSAQVEIKFLNPQNLLELWRHKRTESFQLVYEREVITPDEKGFICLVNLFNYYKFIHDAQKNEIRKSMFDANVRDYQGKTIVNKDIEHSLKDSDVDFWWLNNGVTMVANKIARAGGRLDVENPEIVNGLQTSYVIHDFFSELGAPQSDTRNILLRVIQLSEDQEKPRDQMIRATNNQASIAPLLLHATEMLHHNIEDYFKNSDRPLYYERRKNYYRNRERRLSEIISIQALAQAIIAILLQKPISARSHIKSFLTTETNYNLVFSPEYSLPFYYMCALIRKRTEGLISITLGKNADRQSHGRYVIQHIMTHIGIVLTGNPQGIAVRKEPQLGARVFAEQIASLDLSVITDEVIKSSINQVLQIFEGEPYNALAEAARREDFVRDIIDAAARR